MTTNQIGTLHSPNGLGYRLDFDTTDRYGANGMDSIGSIGSFGWGGAYGSMYRVDPKTGLSIVNGATQEGPMKLAFLASPHEPC